MIRLRDEDLIDELLLYAAKLLICVGIAAAVWIGVVYP